MRDLNVPGGTDLVAAAAAFRAAAIHEDSVASAYESQGLRRRAEADSLRANERNGTAEAVTNSSADSFQRAAEAKKRAAGLYLDAAACEARLDPDWE